MEKYRVKNYGVCITMHNLNKQTKVRLTGEWDIEVRSCTTSV